MHFTSPRSSEPSPNIPEGVLAADPSTMHPRAVEMAEAMRAGSTTYNCLRAAGFSVAEITEFHHEAGRLATTLSTRQVSPGADLLAEMIEKAKAGVANRPPNPKGTRETQAMLVAWNAYCAARGAYVVDPHDAQRERCFVLLQKFFRQTTIGEASLAHVLRAVKDSFGARH